MIIAAVVAAVVTAVGLAWCAAQYWRARDKNAFLEADLASAKRLLAEVSAAAEVPRDLAYYRRMAESRLEIIYRYEQQRDDWKERFMRQSVLHGNAVELVSKNLQRERQLVVRLAALVNKMRAEQKLEPLTQIAEIEAQTKPLDPPVQLAREYIDAVKKQFDEAQKDIDTRRELREAEIAAAKAASAAGVAALGAAT